MSAGREAPELTRLGKHMDRRAGELGLTLVDIARVSGVDRETLRKLRYGLMGKRGAAPRTKHAIEDALGWASGSIDAVDEGRDPTPTGPAGHADTTAGAREATPGEPRRPAGATPDDVLNHLQAAYQLGGAEYFWRAMIEMNRLHNPLVEPIKPSNNDRTA